MESVLAAIQNRHSVRQYTDRVIPEEVRDQLGEELAACNRESGLHIQIVYDDPEGFDSRLAHYGNFRNVRNYIVLAGPKGEEIEERCGYYGERLVLFAQQLGLNTCWTAMTFNRSAAKRWLAEKEQLCMVIALGYGATQGRPHKGKKLSDVVIGKGPMLDWFRMGAEAALMAPTATNQQKFVIGMVHGKPEIRISGLGFYTKVDLGIVKYHFEAASGHLLEHRPR